MSLNALSEVVTDKGYHSGETVLAIEQAEARSYIPEPKRPARKWKGKAEEQKAVYANRRRVKGNYGKRLLKKRGELIERSFAHCYDTGPLEPTNPKPPKTVPCTPAEIARQKSDYEQSAVRKRKQAEEARRQAAENRKQELHQWAALLAQAKVDHQQMLTSDIHFNQTLAQLKEEDRLRAQKAA